MTEVLLSDVLDHSVNIEHLHWNMPLPSDIDPERIAVNEHMFRRTRRLAGVNDVYFCDSQQADAVTFVTDSPSKKVRPDLESRINIWIPLQNEQVDQPQDQSETSPTVQFAQNTSRQFKNAALTASLRSNVTEPVNFPYHCFKSPEMPISDRLGGLLLAGTSVVSTGLFVAAGVDSLFVLTVVENIELAGVMGGMSSGFVLLFAGIDAARRHLKLDIADKKVPLKDLKWSFLPPISMKIDRFAASAVNRGLSKPLLRVKS